MPTASVCTTPFSHLARHMAESLGAPELPIVLLEQRLADRMPEELEAMARSSVEDIVCALILPL